MTMSADAGRREDRRQLLHLAMTGFALALRWLTPTQAAICAGGAVVFNWLILPRLAPGLRRENAPRVDGIRLYPIAVLVLVLVLPLPLAAAAWGVLGVGDSVSNLAGRRWGRPPFLGRADRSLVGSLAFVLCAAPAAFGLWVFVANTVPDGRMLLVAGVAALAGALAELLPLPSWLDDNLPVAAAAGLALHLCAN